MNFELAVLGALLAVGLTVSLNSSISSLLFLSRHESAAKQYNLALSYMHT